MENSNQYGDVDNEQPISTFGLFEPHNKRRSSILSYSIVTIALVVFGVLFSYFGFSKNNPNQFLLIFIILVGFILLTFVHEGAHFVFQWIFSRKKPKIGFIWPYPYSALAANVRVTRNQAILFSLAPFLFITPLLIISSFFTSNLFRLVTITIALLEVALICPSRLNPAIAAVRDTRRAATGIAVTVYEGMFGANGPLLPPGQT